PTDHRLPHTARTVPERRRARRRERHRPGHHGGPGRPRDGMTSWLLPVVAAAFWLGILLEPVLRAVLPAWDLLALGLATLGGLPLVVPRAATGADPLPRAGLASQEPAALSSLGSGRPSAARAPPAAALAMVLAFVVLGAAWSGLRTDRLRHSPLTRLAGKQVRVAGELRTDPSPGRFGWWSVAALSLVRGPVDARIHETVWIEAKRGMSRARRGDRFVAAGLLELPTDRGFAQFLDRRGAALVLRADAFRRTGGSGNPLVRLAQTARSALLARVRAIFPTRQAGLLMGLALGDT